jgi:predicted MFS family arabinose efflux permease
MIGDGVESGYIAPYLADHGAGSETNAAVIITVYGLLVTVGSWSAGALSDVWGPRRVMTIGLVGWAVLEVLFLAVALPSESFVLMMVIYGLRGAFYPLFAYGFLVWVLAASPAHRLGSAVGWFYFGFTGGLPTLGALVASGTQPIIGEYLTFWVSLVLVVLGGLCALVGLRGAQGGRRLAPPEITLGKSLLSGVAIAFQKPNIGLGCLVRVINTAPQFGAFVFFPTVFAVELGFGTAGWLQLVFVMGGANVFANLFFGVLSDRLGWHRTLRWFGCFGCAITIAAFYFVPQMTENYALAVLCAGLYGVTLAAFTPISVLVSLMAPGQKGSAIAVLNLGAGAAVFVGPLIVAIFLAPLGGAGVTIIFSALYVLAGIAVRWLTIPEQSKHAVEAQASLQDLVEHPDEIADESEFPHRGHGVAER